MLKVVAWNVRRATASSSCWDVLSDIDPDVAVLQEVGEVPVELRRTHEVAEEFPSTKSGGQQKFKTVILAKGQIGEEIALTSRLDWVNNERAWFRGNIVARKVRLGGDEPLNIISFYSPAWRVDPGRLSGIDVQGVKLERNPDVWCTEILWSLLVTSMHQHPGPWIVGGDFNSSETFDAWRVGGRGNLEIIERMNALGLVDCLRSQHGKLVPTFRSPRGGQILHQMDHLYVSDQLLSRLRSCDVGSPTEIFGHSLSDHLPIVAEFGDVPGGGVGL